MYPYLFSVYGLGAGESIPWSRKVDDSPHANSCASYFVRHGPYGLRKFSLVDSQPMPHFSLVSKRLAPARVLIHYYRATRPGSKWNTSRVIFGCIR